MEGGLKEADPACKAVPLGEARGGEWDDYHSSRRDTFEGYLDLSSNEAVPPPRRYYKFMRPGVREAIASGAYPIEHEDVVRTFLQDFEKQSYLVMQDRVKGKRLAMQAPKLGNQAWARRKKKQVRVVEDRMSLHSFNSPAYQDHGHYYSNVTGLFITLTPPQRSISLYEFNRRLRSSIPRFKTYLQRELGSDVPVLDSLDRRRVRREPARLVFITGKEGSKSGYFVPHVDVILDRSVKCRKHDYRVNGQDKSRYILDDNAMKAAIEDCWTRALFTKEERQRDPTLRAFVDVRGFYNDDGSSASYSTGYMTKGLVSSAVVSEDGSVPLTNTALNTFAWCKALNYRPITFSKAFKDLLAISRLDYCLGGLTQSVYSLSDVVATKRASVAFEISQINGEVVSGPPRPSSLDAFVRSISHGSRANASRGLYKYRCGLRRGTVS